MFEKVKQRGEERKKKIRKITLAAEKNQMLDPQDLIREFYRKKVEKNEMKKRKEKKRNQKENNEREREKK